MSPPQDEPLPPVPEVGRRLISDLELDRILRHVLQAAVDVTGARYAALGVLDPSRTKLERFVYLGIDERTRERIGELPTGRGVLGELIENPVPLRLSNVAEHPASFGFPEGHPPMRTFLGVPITVAGLEWGNLYLTEKQGGGDFDDADQRTAVALADWASVAIGNARSVATERLRFAIDAAEQERMQWARELHDETLQGLAAVRMLLATGRRGADPDRLGDAVERSIEQIDVEIGAMRALISDLRPDSLDELGIPAALESLCRRMNARFDGARIEVRASRKEIDRERPSRSVELVLYRVAQEAITNAVRHGSAKRIAVELELDDREMSISIRDDGTGFDLKQATLGFGIIGMRERAELAGGELAITSRPGGGTTVSLSVPLDP